MWLHSPLFDLGLLSDQLAQLNSSEFFLLNRVEQIEAVVGVNHVVLLFLSKSLGHVNRSNEELRILDKLEWRHVKCLFCIIDHKFGVLDLYIKYIN